MQGVAKVVHKELLQINKKSLYNDTAVCEPYNEDNPLKVKVTLTPQDGFYAGGTFEFELIVPENYPDKPPSVTCKTKVYHPNISYEGVVCLSMLNDANPNYHIEHYVNGLLFLFHHPNVESRLNSNVTPDASKLKVFVRESMRGKPVNGMKFPCVIQKPPEFEENLEVFLEGLDSKNLYATAFGNNTMEFPLEKLATYIAAVPTATIKVDTLLPFIRPALATKMDLSLFYARSDSGGVLRRTAALQAPEAQVLKEMVLLVNGKPVTVLTNGTGKINTPQLAEELKAQVEIPRMKQLREILQGGRPSAFLAEPTETVYVNEDILNQDCVYTASGCKWVLVKIKPKDLCTLVPNLKAVRNFSSTTTKKTTTTTTTTSPEAPLTSRKLSTDLVVEGKKK